MLQQTAIAAVLLLLSATLSEAGEEASFSPETLHTASVRAGIERMLEGPTLTDAQRAIVEDGLRSFLADRDLLGADASLQPVRVTRSILEPREEEVLELLRVGEGEIDRPDGGPNPPGSGGTGEPADDTPEPDGATEDEGDVSSAPEEILPIGGVVCLSGDELLLGNRFVVRATVTNLNGLSFRAPACRMTPIAGYFHYGDVTNVEFVLKMLNTCSWATPPAHWIFIAGMTNFGIQMTFFDLFFGTAVTYTSPVGTTFQSVLDQRTPFSCP